VALTAAAASCGDDDSGAGATTTAADGPAAGEVTADGISPERCAANRAAGTITYLSSFDFAATASIVEVVVAHERGYFDAMCLDVELKSSFSVENYPAIAENQAQFSSGGSYSEVLDFAARNGANFVVVAVEGRTAIDGLIVKEGEASALEDLRGTTIGVKGKITPSVKAMLAGAGLVEGEDYETVLIDGFDPKVHIELPGIVGFPGYKSNEPGQLERAGIPFTLFDPADYGVPGSFGILYTNASFVNEHPTAAQDFVRAAMKGLADAVADPAAAAAICLEAIKANGNKFFLSDEGETFRWATESALVRDLTPAGTPLGVPDPALLQAEVDAYASIGLFGDTTPPIEGTYDVALISGVYDDNGSVIWPKGDS
jgi:NitT/TauT family transport system substrate-binding protein